MNLWHQEILYTARQLFRSGAFSVAVVLTLAVGIGLNTVIFTVVDCVLLRPLGYRDADRIYSLNTHLLDKNQTIPRLGGDDYSDVAERVHSFEATAYFQGYDDGAQVNGRTIYLPIAFVSPGFGRVMGVEPVAGRLFHDDADGQEAMVSASLAREQFGTEAGSLGGAVLYDGKARTIVGVLPIGFSFPGKSQIWVEAPLRPDVPNRTAYNQHAVAKVRPGVTSTALRAEMATLSAQLRAAYAEDRGKGLEAVPLQEQLVGSVRPLLLLLMGSVCVVMLLVFTNVSHLQLVRSTRMRREVSIRAALGATLRSIVRRTVTESVLLAGTGFWLALLLANPTLRLLTVIAPKELPRLHDIHLKGDVLGFSMGISLATMIVAGLVPAWRSWKANPAAALKQEQRNPSESRQSRRVRDALMVSQVAMTLVLSVASVLLVRQMIEISKRDLGFTPDHLIVLDTHAQRAANESYAARMERLKAVEDAVGHISGVKSVGAAGGVPMQSDSSNVGYAIRGRSEFRSGASLPSADIVPVTPQYFATMQIPLMSGRLLNEQDDEHHAPVLLVSEELAQRQFAGMNPIGQQIMCGYTAERNWWTIVGVVGNVRQRSAAQPPSQTFYIPLAQHAVRASDVQLVVRTTTDAVAMAGALESEVLRNFPAVAVKSTTMEEAIGESSRAQRFRTLLFACFAGVSILLAGVGIYGITAYTISQRRFEFALRMAVGADRGRVVWSTLGSGLAKAIAGIGLGLVMSVELLRGLSSVLGKVPAFDLVSYGSAVAGVLATIVVALLLPCQRVSSMDPIEVLRGE